MDIFKYVPAFALYLVLLNTATMVALTCYFWKQLDEPATILKSTMQWGAIGCTVCLALVFYLSAPLISAEHFGLVALFYAGANYGARDVRRQTL